MPPSQCSLSWFVKKPVYLSVSQSDPSDLTHSGVAVIDVMFPTVSSFPFSQMSFKNNYTAFITLKGTLKQFSQIFTLLDKIMRKFRFLLSKMLFFKVLFGQPVLRFSANFLHRLRANDQSCLP